MSPPVTVPGGSRVVPTLSAHGRPRCSRARQGQGVTDVRSAEVWRGSTPFRDAAARRPPAHSPRAVSSMAATAAQSPSAPGVVGTVSTWPTSTTAFVWAAHGDQPRRDQPRYDRRGARPDQRSPWPDRCAACASPSGGSLAGSGACLHPCAWSRRPSAVDRVPRPQGSSSGSSTSASTCRGRSVPKWRRSRVASFGSPSRSVTARTAASTKPMSASAYRSESSRTRR